ncbi:hypothetical protein D3C87_1505290 [compost metagenome]
MPLDQSAVQLGFQAAQGLADRRLRQMQFDSSAANTALFRDHQESTKKIPIQTVSHAGNRCRRHGLFFHSALNNKELMEFEDAISSPPSLVYFNINFP